MRRSIQLLSFCLVVAALAGCGNKGPLILPTRTAAVKAPAKTLAPAPASSSATPMNEQQR